MPDSVGRLDIALEHTTSVLTRPVIRMADSDVFDGRDPQRELPTLSVNSYSCVFASLLEDGVLIHSQGNTYLDNLQTSLIWHGNSNLFHHYKVYWKIERGGFDLESTLMSYSEWNETWSHVSDGQAEEAVEFESDVWSEVGVMETLSGAGLSDFATPFFALSRAQFFSGNAGMTLSPDGRIPGVDASLLTEFPSALPLLPAETLPDGTN
ncbi:MAG: hypothetical protein GY826_13820, partial [Fuerstiella sp.]|nr:hypothetical protein [Fuerstiella sp.]